VQEFLSASILLYKRSSVSITSVAAAAAAVLWSLPTHGRTAASPADLAYHRGEWGHVTTTCRLQLWDTAILAAIADKESRDIIGLHVQLTRSCSLPVPPSECMFAEPPLTHHIGSLLSASSTLVFYHKDCRSVFWSIVCRFIRAQIVLNIWWDLTAVELLTEF